MNTKKAGKVAEQPTRTKRQVDKSEAALTQSAVSEVAAREETILAFWREHDIFKKSLEQPGGGAPKGDYVFYDGPPFATGLPHYGHILASTLKDAVPRFWTMQGYRVRRQWGWDCHGLPLENLIEKKLGLATKRDIEDYGVQNFNEAARDAVLEYADDWKQIIPRMGRFADMENDYKTMDSSYTESVWWVFKSLHEKGLVYEGFKGMHLCPRCGTTLSNFEVNQGYKDIKDIAVTVKLPLLDDAGNPTDTSLLVWTTTPWTLPGNMAAAVHNDHTYAKVRVTNEAGTDEYVVLAQERLVQLGDVVYEVVDEMKGSDLVGKSYQPPFPYWQDQTFENKANAWKIYHADYVELGTEGTGAVHLAPAYGEEDMELAKVHGIPIVHHVDSEGHFMDFVTDFAGQLVKPKDDDEAGVTHLDADIEIVKALKASGRLFKKENITHSYPHCWRCDTPLLNYATTSWFVKVTDIKDRLVAENKTVKWVPEHVGANRFGKWLEGARDWAVSRQRYWGAPLPIWRNPAMKDYKVFGSLAELQAYVPKSGNTYFTMRHGESEKNVLGIVTDEIDKYPLTAEGVAQSAAAAAAYKGSIDLIITSPVLRAKQTAETVATTLGLTEQAIVVDDRIKEISHGDYQGMSLAEYREKFPKEARFEHKPEGGETWIDVRQRVGACLFDLEKAYHGKRILIISHGDPLLVLHGVAAAAGREQILLNHDTDYPEKGMIREMSFTPYPHNDNYELDYHRPYIDTVELVDTDGTKLERVPDVFDCWFESGSMPYGQHHYPFEHAETFIKELFPADFIAESIDQTRGWFYSTMVLGVALFDTTPYKHVVTNGLVLAEDGRKMSKSLQNYPDPMELVARQGADTMRFYLLSSSIIKGEDLNFSEKEVGELVRKNIGRLHNVLAMYEEYADGGEARSDSAHILDRWIVARLNQLITEVTAGYTQYELDRATRPVTDFIDDLSVWYLRRSRDRIKGDDASDAAAALATLRYVLQTLALVIAPAMPFYAEYLWQQVKGDNEAESVHLAKWPEAGDVDPDMLTTMSFVRSFATIGLNQRVQNKVNVRKPLQSFWIKHEGEKPKYWNECELILREELNVKEVIELRSGLGQDMPGSDFDWEITPALKAEGDAREFMRQVQERRKAEGFAPKDRITLTVQTSDGGEAIIKAHQADIARVVGATVITFGDAVGTEIVAGEHSFTVQIDKVS